MTEPIIYNKYQRGKIYEIRCNITGEVYYGSTTEPTVARRLSTHVSNYKRWKKGTHNFVSSFPIIERGDFNIYLVELHPCGSKDELNRREGWFHLNCECVNKNVAGQTRAEYEASHKKERAEYEVEYNILTQYSRQKKYIALNRDKINEKQRQIRLSKKLSQSILNASIETKDAEGLDPISQYT